MGNVSFGMLASVDGYIAGPPGGRDMPMFGDELHRHFNERMRSTALYLCGRELYEVMQYWDEDDASWSEVAAEFATDWQATPKAVVSTTLTEVGPSATLISSDIDAQLQKIIGETDGDIEVGGPTLARTLTRLGLIDEYDIYLRPAVLGDGKPFFAAGNTPDVALLDVEVLPDDTVLLRYQPVR
jgi:dihydrofolate reductase